MSYTFKEEMERDRKWKESSIAFLKKEIKEKGIEEVLFEIFRSVKPNSYGKAGI